MIHTHTAWDDKVQRRHNDSWRLSCHLKSMFAKNFHSQYEHQIKVKLPRFVTNWHDNNREKKTHQQQWRILIYFETQTKLVQIDPVVTIYCANKRTFQQIIGKWRRKQRQQSHILLSHEKRKVVNRKIQNKM